jgi:NADPH:quinone reductase-like Zn-dependent oxidoreductase
MRQIQFTRTGDPTVVARIVDVPKPTIANPGEVLVRVDLFPINPADLLTLQGFYPRGNLGVPVLGVEATGTVEEVGRGVTEPKVGARVILLGRDLWSEFVVADQDDVVALAPDIDPQRAACLKVNPATAALLLREFAALEPGDWLVHNAANSAVGRAVSALARHRGLRVVSVVRRPELVPAAGPGHRAVALDGADLAQQVADITHGEPVALALDGVAGGATANLIAACADGATVVGYGAASGQQAQVDPAALVFRDIRLRGFWLTRWLAAANSSTRRELYRELEQLADPLDLTPRVDSIVPADDIGGALARAVRIGAAGKVLVSFA